MPSYEQFLSNMQQGFAGQDFMSYANNSNVPVTYNQDLNRLIVGKTAVDMGNLNLKYQDGKLYGPETTYKQLLQPYIEKGSQPDIMQLQPYETPDWIKQYLSDMVAEQMSPWEYNMEEDPSVIAAREQLEKSMAAMAGKRGFLYGNAQQQLVQQSFNQIAPMFEEVAYQKQADRYQRQMQLANTIMQWDDMQANRKMNENELIKLKTDFMLTLNQRDLEIFKTMLQQRRFNMELELEEQRFEMEKQKTELDLAWRRVSELGYADNTAASILGVKPGTEAGWVKQLTLKHKQELAKMKKKNQYDIEMLKINKKAEMDIIKEQERVQTKSQMELMEIEYGFEKEIIGVKEKYRRKLEAKRKAEAEAEARKRAAEAAEKERLKAEKKLKENQFNLEYNGIKSRFREKFVRNGYVPDSKTTAAAEYLYEQYATGTISKEVYNRMLAEYWLSESFPTSNKYAEPLNVPGVTATQDFMINFSRRYETGK